MGYGRHALLALLAGLATVAVARPARAQYCIVRASIDVRVQPSAGHALARHIVVCSGRVDRDASALALEPDHGTDRGSLRVTLGGAGKSVAVSADGRVALRFELDGVGTLVVPAGRGAITVTTIDADRVEGTFAGSAQLNGAWTAVSGSFVAYAP